MKKYKEFGLNTITDLKVFLLFLLDNIRYPIDGRTMLDIIEENTDTTGLKIDSNSIPNAVVLFLRGLATDKGRTYIDNKFLKQQ